MKKLFYSIFSLLLAYIHVLSAATTPMLFTLHTNTATWNDAKRACTGSEMDLAQPKTEPIYTALKLYLNHWKYQLSLSVDNIWIGLYDKTYTSTSEYAWTDCSAFNTSATTLRWDDEHDNALMKKCVGLSRENDIIHRARCMDNLFFVCQAQLDSCWYDTIMNAKMTNSSLHVNTADESECRYICLHNTNMTEECIAMSFSGHGICDLMTGTETLFFDSPDVVFSLSTVTAVKRCFWHSLNHTFPPSNRAFEDFPIHTCSADPNTATKGTHILPAKSKVNTTTKYLSLPPSSTIIDSSSISVDSVSPSYPLPRGFVTLTLTPTCHTIAETSEVTLKPSYACPSVSNFDISSVTMYSTATVTETHTATTTHVITKTITEHLVSVRSKMVTYYEQMATSAIIPCHTQAPIRRFISDRNASNYDDLVLDSRGLSSSRRKRTSAYDGRPTAIFVGTVGIAVITGILTAVIVLDSGRFIRHVRKWKRRRKRKKARQRQNQDI